MAQYSNTLIVSPRMLQLGAEFYPMQNVTRFGVIKVPARRTGAVLTGVILALAGIMLLSSAPPAGLAVMLVAIAVFVYAKLKKDRYALYIETSAGSAELLMSTDREAIESIVLAIAEAQQSRSENVVYRFNIAGDVIAGDSIHGNGTVVNRSKNAQLPRATRSMSA